MAQARVQRNALAPACSNLAPTPSSLAIGEAHQAGRELPAPVG